MALKDLLRDVRSSKPTSIVGRLDRFIVQRAARPSAREKDVWHPSEIVQTSFCSRLEVLARRHGLRTVAEVDVEMERIFDVGHAVHHWYQEKYLGPMGILWGNWRCSRCFTVVQGLMPKDSCTTCQWQVGAGRRDLTPKDCTTSCGSQDVHPEQDARARLMQETARRGGCIHCGRWGRWEFLETVVRIPECNILGRTDGLLLDEKGSPEIVADIKTANDRRFGALSAAGPSETNIKQVNLYMHGLGKTRGCVLYVCKNDGRVAEFHFEYNRKLIEKELADTQEMERVLADPSLPLPRRHQECGTANTKRACACPAKGHCFKERANDPPS